MDRIGQTDWTGVTLSRLLGPPAHKRSKGTGDSDAWVWDGAGGVPAGMQAATAVLQAFVASTCVVMCSEHALVRMDGLQLGHAAVLASISSSLPVED